MDTWLGHWASGWTLTQHFPFVRAIEFTSIYQGAVFPAWVNWNRKGESKSYQSRAGAAGARLQSPALTKTAALTHSVNTVLFARQMLNGINRQAVGTRTPSLTREIQSITAKFYWKETNSMEELRQDMNSIYCSWQCSRYTEDKGCAHIISSPKVCNNCPLYPCISSPNCAGLQYWTSGGHRTLDQGMHCNACRRRLGCQLATQCR